MAGALVLARAAGEGPLSDELLATVAARLLERWRRRPRRAGRGQEWV